MVRLCCRGPALRLPCLLFVATCALALATAGCWLKKDDETSTGGGGEGASSTGTGGTGTGTGVGGTGGAEPESDWVASDTGAGVTLEAVWSVDDLVIAVGESGTIVRSDDAGASWSTVTSGVADHLYGVWHDGSKAWVVGASGTVLFSDDGGQSFASRDAGVTLDLTAVWGLGPSDVLVSGLDVDTLHSGDDGQTWTSLSTMSLTAFWGINETDIYGISQSYVQRSTNGGDTWSTLWGSYANTDHMDVWAHSSGYIVAVTGWGTVFTYDGGWTYSVPLGERSLNGIWGDAPSNLFIVGDGGSMMRSSTQERCRWIDTSFDLRDVHGSAGRAYVVGETGMSWSCALSD